MSHPYPLFPVNNLIAAIPPPTYPSPPFPRPPSEIVIRGVMEGEVLLLPYILYNPICHHSNRCPHAFILVPSENYVTSENAPPWYGALLFYPRLTPSHHSPNNDNFVFLINLAPSPHSSLSLVSILPLYISLSLSISFSSSSFITLPQSLALTLSYLCLLNLFSIFFSS